MIVLADNVNNLAQLQTSLNNQIMKALIGIPQPYPSATVPLGWLSMNGQAINVTKYPILARMYGTYLPDLRGEFRPINTNFHYICFGGEGIAD